MVANLAKPTPERPALMTHDGMEPFFSSVISSVNLSVVLQCCRCRHFLPRVRTCRTRIIEQNAVLEVPWNKVCIPSVPFLHIGPCADYGEFVCSVARDFVEAPSQMLENWGWEPKVLKKISSHYKTQDPLPDDLIQKLIKRFVRPHKLTETRGIHTGCRAAHKSHFYSLKSVRQRRTVLPSAAFLRHI